MSGYIEGTDRGQTTLFPDRLEDWIGEDNSFHNGDTEAVSLSNESLIAVSKGILEGMRLVTAERKNEDMKSRITEFLSLRRTQLFSAMAEASSGASPMSAHGSSN